MYVCMYSSNNYNNIDISLLCIVGIYKFLLHRYMFKNAKRVGMQELGPRFTLKLRSIQRGTFDSKYGEYYWIHKVCAETFVQAGSHHSFSFT